MLTMENQQDFTDVLKIVGINSKEYGHQAHVRI